VPAASSPGPDAAGGIVQVNEGDLPWSAYIDPGGARSAIRYKALTSGLPDVPPVQYIEYGPGQTDPVHHHATGELFIVTDGELWLQEARTCSGGVVYIPAHTDYSARAGPEGARYFRVVVR
jgi:hypothetical protein